MIKTYTIAEAAKLLRVCKETIRRQIKNGSLKAAKLGGQYRLSATDLEEYYRQQGGGVLFDQVG